MERVAEASPRFKARIAGVLSLLSLLAAVFGEFIVRRLEFAEDLVAVSCMVAVALLLYGIFKPVNRGLSLLAASFNLVGLTFGALRLNPRRVDIPVVLNGCYCFLVGYLIFRSTFLPRILGALIMFAGLSWVTYLSPPLANHLSPLQSGPRHPRARIGNAVAPRDGRERATMEGAGQRSGMNGSSIHLPPVKTVFLSRTCEIDRFRPVIAPEF
jgi:hypothetical protein